MQYFGNMLSEIAFTQDSLKNTLKHSFIHWEKYWRAKCFLDYIWVFFYPVPWIHLCRLIQNEFHIWVHYLHWIYLSLLFAEIWIYFEPIPFLILAVRGYWKWKKKKKTMPVLILALLFTLYCVLLQLGTQQ